jgi:RNA polymerase sigma-70 factor (ECF subfamily)
MVENHGLPDGRPAESILLDRLSQGDVHAFDAIYRTYAASVYRNAFMLLKDPSAAEDLVQETFLSLWSSRHRMAGRMSAGGWLFLTCHNRCVNQIKRRLTEKKAQHEIERVPSGSDDGGAFLERGLSLMENAIDGLSHRQQQALTLCKLQGKSYEEAAGIMDVSRHTVKEYLSIAIRSIRAYVKERAASTMVSLMVLTARLLSWAE